MSTFTSADIKTEQGKALYAAFKKLDGGRAWTKGAYARDGIGRRVGVNEPTASCFCVMGACLAVGTSTVPLFITIKGGQMATFNDDPTTTWQDIRKWFGRAIKHAEGVK